MRKILIILFLFLATILEAAHIVGGVMYYTCLGNNQYEITFKIYRDCSILPGQGATEFDNTAQFGVFQGTAIFDQIETFLESERNIPPIPSNPCFQAPANVCVNEGVYKFIVDLPANTGTYTIVHQRCCRNNTIVNILTPGDVGATYFVEINTNNNLCNNSPVFNDFPPIAICANEPLIFDHGATDVDGDRLEYSFYTPLGSINNNGSGLDPITPAGFPSEPPYVNVNWQGGFNINNQVASNPGLIINPVTGLLTGTPNQIGQYVVGILVKEFRNNVLIGEIRRDFQFNVTQCLSGVRAIVPTINTTDPIAAGTDGIYVYECNDFTVQFENNSQLGTFYKWDFGNNNATNDTSNAFEPSYTFPDTGVYFVKLVVNPGLNCSDSTTVVVKIYPQFATDFSFLEQCEPSAIPFADQTTSSFNDVNSWLWNFGDGNTSTQQSPQHFFQNAGTYNVRLISTSSRGCIDTLNRNVTLHAKPNANFDNTPTCITKPIDFFDTSTLPFGNINTWEWSANNNIINTNESFTTTYTALQTFNIQLIVTTDFGCKDTILKPITIFPLPQITFPYDFETCFNDTIQFNATGGEIYNWYSTIGDTINNIQNPQYITSQTTNFTVEVIDVNECSSAGSFLVTVFPLPFIDAGKDTFICLGDAYQFNAVGSVQFSWSPGSVLNDSTVNNPVATIRDTTLFVFTTISPQGCKNKDSIIVNVQKPIISTATNDTFICEKDTIQLNTNGGIFYEWSPATSLNNATIANPLAFPEITTDYTVKVSNNCFDTTLNVNVIVYPLPIVNAGIDDTVYRADSTILTGSGGGDYLWKPGFSVSDSTSENPFAKPFNTTAYTLQVTDENGCINFDTVIIYVDATTLLLIPTAFSPNNDKTNDVFRIIRALNILKLIEFKVFNRWGEMVFETTDIKKGWDGFHKGEPADLGVYQFFAKAITFDGNLVVEKGNVTLLR